MRAGPIALCFFVDALGWETLERHGDGLRRIAPHAYRQRTVLGYSCAAQPTILTGLMPNEHGHWGMFYRSGRSEMSPLATFRWLPRVVSYHPRFRRALLNWHRTRSGFTGYYNLYQIPYELFAEFDLIEKRDIYAPGGFDEGVDSIFDLLAERSVPYRRWTWKSGFEESFGELKSALSGPEQPAFAMLYTPLIDAFLHEHIGDEKAVHAAVARVEEAIADAVRQAREVADEVRVLIFSDHGMARTTGTVDLMKGIDELGLNQGRDYIAFYDSTMARFWFANGEARERIQGALDLLDCGDILSEETLRSEGVYFEDARFGELIFLMRPGLLIVPSHMGQQGPRGMHGYTPDHEDSYAMIMSSEPLEPEPTHIRDTFVALEGLAPQASP